MGTKGGPIIAYK